MLDELLQYHDSPEADDFKAKVMQRVQAHAARQQRLRRVILWGTGAVGAAFGVAGFMMLSGPVGQMVSQVNPLVISLSVAGAVGFFFWLLQDEAATTG